MCQHSSYRNSAENLPTFRLQELGREFAGIPPTGTRQKNCRHSAYRNATENLLPGATASSFQGAASSSQCPRFDFPWHLGPTSRFHGSRLEPFLLFTCIVILWAVGLVDRRFSWQRLSFLFIVFLLLLCVMFVVIFLRFDSSGWCSLTGSKSVLGSGAIL